MKRLLNNKNQKGLAPSKARGFTLIELMVVIAVIAILSTIALFGLRQAQSNARDVQRLGIMSSVRGQLERYYGDTGGYPLTGTGFGAMMTTIAFTPAPVDPGCGGTTTYTWSGTGTWAPCGTVQYQYTGTATTYTLTLMKEGGGQKQFSNPQ